MPIKKDDAFPLTVRTDNYKYLVDNTVNYHWHNDFEFGVLLSGSAHFYINDTLIKLEKGDGYFMNTNIMHKGEKTDGNEDAVMYTLTFSASLLSSNTNGTVYKKYINPILYTQIEGFKIKEENHFGREVKALLMKIYQLEDSAFGYELTCLEYLNRLWLNTLLYIENNKVDLLHCSRDIRYAERIKDILSYIHEHFNEKIRAEDIANHVKISRGECFRCFKRFMNKRLVEYINEYRLQRAAKLLRETEKKVIDICIECGFENASYFGKAFKDVYSRTPMQYRKARIWTNNTIQNIGNYDYEYWKDSGTGTMTITGDANNGSFSCEWNNISNILFRSGKKFYGRDKTHGQIGSISIQYDSVYNPYGDSYLCVYGWTIEPLVEWYIIERYTTYKPSGDAVRLGMLNTEDGIYEIYKTTRVNQPSILGVESFNQYWSIRTSGRSSGIVNVSAHFQAWESLGLTMGRLTEVALNIEGWKSSGNATVYTNVISIGNA